ncbi:DUF1630-domain-containing protein [Cystobasidium minutum MCA 4210]|uniref:DUF1630-domain-containing protein n=1 Tax=Cystobasidium minutum MCA 4210 TaxID=1397322 RepID=UPI0034CDAC50|eukprot:jgi/Rhomi1/196975/gm1.5189_g
MYGRRAGPPDSLMLSSTKKPVLTQTPSKTDLDIDDEGDLSLATRALHSPTQSSFSTFNSNGGHNLAPGNSLLRRSSSYGGGSPSTHNHTRKRKQTLTRAHDLPTAVLPQELLERTKQVIDSICIINFDLDSGPEFDNCYPPADYSAKERSLIAFSSFPDHTEKGNSSLTFNWRIPRLQSDIGSANIGGNTSRTTPISEILHGYVYFSQQKDTSIRRGYAQRSIVIITHHPEWNGLFTKMVNILGPMYFDAKPGHAASVVETAIHNIYKWPSLEPGTVELAFLGHILLVEIPLPHQAQFRTPYNSVRSHFLSSTSSLPANLSIPPPSPASIPLLASLPAFSLSQILRETISQLWLNWELMILAEPILVYSPDPSRCSELVRWLLAMIKPLPFAGDYRPFFQIHTPDFAFILNNNKPRPGTLLGATNPLILSAARHYPHIIRLSSPPPTDFASSSTSAQLNGSSGTGGVFRSISKATASHSFKEAQGTPHGIFSERKRHIKKDTTALKAAEEKIKARDYAAADAILLQCMSTLTERFLVPLNRYFATLLPADTSDGMSTPQKAASFNQAAFLQSLKTHGTPLSFRRSKMPSMNMHSGNDTTATASAISFYERFLQSPNFLTWLRSRTEVTQYTTRARYLQRLETADPAAFLRGKSDAQMEDLQRRLEREARLTEEDLRHAPTMARQRSMSHDVNASGRISPFPTSPSQTDLIKRSERLRSQVERVKALRQSNQDSDDSDASSIPSIV